MSCVYCIDCYLFFCVVKFVCYFFFGDFGYGLVRSFFFFFKQKTAYEMRISDWSSDVCSSDLLLKANPSLDLLADPRVLIAKPLLEAFGKRLDAALAKASTEQLTLSLDDFEDEKLFKGSDLAGTVARHPMHHLGGFFARPRPFLAGDFVTTDSGTGLVHMSPDHGEDDFDLCKANGIDPVFAVEADGKYREDWGWLGGQGSVINAKFNAPEGPIRSEERRGGEVGGSTYRS